MLGRGLWLRFSPDILLGIMVQIAKQLLSFCLEISLFLPDLLSSNFLGFFALELQHVPRANSSVADELSTRVSTWAPMPDGIFERWLLRSST
jgi:hypothetical protein